MARYLRFSDQEKALMWERWRKGDCLREIARLLKRGPSSISKVLRRTGGVQPVPRTRSSRALSLEERETISRGLACGKSLRAIAREINRAPSTVSQEVKRNNGSVHYRATTADQEALCRALRPKECKLAQRTKLVKKIATQLQKEWSPQQIAGYLSIIS